MTASSPNVAWSAESFTARARWSFAFESSELYHSLISRRSARGLRPGGCSKNRVTPRAVLWYTASTTALTNSSDCIAPLEHSRIRHSDQPIQMSPTVLSATAVPNASVVEQIWDKRTTPASNQRHRPLRVDLVLAPLLELDRPSHLAVRPLTVRLVNKRPSVTDTQQGFQ
jgi:hypothetical protein